MGSSVGHILALHKLFLENEPGPSARCRVGSRRVRGPWSHLRGEANQNRMQGSIKWGQRQEEAADHSHRLMAKKVTGYFYIPKALAFVPGAWNIQFVLDVSEAIHLHKSRDVDHECGHSSGMQRRQALVVSTKPRCHIRADVASLSTTTETTRIAALHDHRLQLRPDKEASLVQQYPRGCSEADPGAQRRSG